MVNEPTETKSDMPPPRLLITTVGTSLLTNRDDRPWAGWNRAGQPLPNASDVDQWLAAANPVTASAETNTLNGLDVQSADRVCLLHSDTPEGRFCSERLQHFYNAVVRCHEVTGRSLTALGYEHANFSQRGLKVLVEEVIAAVRSARERSIEPVFCATGGFKAEIAFLNLIGALLTVEVYYIHEQFREIVRLPRLPLTWDTDWVLQRRAFFEWIDEGPRPRHEVENRLRADPGLSPLVEHSADGSYLNAAGDLLFRAAKEVGPRATWPPAVPRPPDRKNGLAGVQHHRPRGWQAVVKLLCEIDCVSFVRYDPDVHGGARVKLIDGASGSIAVRFGPPENELPLRVETSARGEAQTMLVRDYIANQVGA